MKLILLYGPPAVGKLTIAELLLKTADYRLLQNNHAIQLASSLFPFGSSPHTELVDSVRLVAIEAALKEDLYGIVFTYCYCHPQDDFFIEELTKLLQRYDGNFIPVQLKCALELLEERVVNEDRCRFGKIRSAKMLRKLLEDSELLTEIPNVKSLEIDNSDASPEKVVKQIVDYVDEMDNS